MSAELSDLMSLAITKRYELDVLIKMLLNVQQGRDLLEDYAPRSPRLGRVRNAEIKNGGKWKRSNAHVE